MVAALILLLLADDLAGLKDPTRRVREQAVHALAESDVTTATLVAHLADPNLRVATGVARALGERADTAALPALARAADDPARTRATAAAEALVAIAFERGVFVEGQHFDAMTRLPQRLEAATRAAVLRALARARYGPTLSRVAVYRPLLAGGRYAAGALQDLVKDDHRSVRMRAHALHAYARLVGRAAGPLINAMLDHGEPDLRSAAAALAARYGIGTATRRLAQRLETKRRMTPAETAVGVRSLSPETSVGDHAARRLERAVRGVDYYLAADAAKALRTARPERGGQVIRARMDELLKAPALSSGTAMAIVLFWNRLGPLDDGTRRRMIESDLAVLKAALAPDWTAARGHLGKLFAPERPQGYAEAARVRVVYELMRDRVVPRADRVAFARGLLVSDASALRRYALWTLRGVPRPEWKALQPLVARCLRDRYEPTRLAAAALLAPDPAAVRVCLDALYAGDPASARLVCGILGDGLKIDPEAPVAERRRRAVELSKGE